MIHNINLAVDTYLELRGPLNLITVAENTIPDMEGSTYLTRLFKDVERDLGLSDHLPAAAELICIGLAERNKYIT